MIDRLSAIIDVRKKQANSVERWSIFCFAAHAYHESSDKAGSGSPCYSGLNFNHPFLQGSHDHMAILRGKHNEVQDDVDDSMVATDQEDWRETLIQQAGNKCLICNVSGDDVGLFCTGSTPLARALHTVFVVCPQHSQTRIQSLPTTKPDSSPVTLQQVPDIAAEDFRTYTDSGKKRYPDKCPCCWCPPTTSRWVSIPIARWRDESDHMCEACLKSLQPDQRHQRLLDGTATEPEYVAFEIFRREGLHLAPAHLGRDFNVSHANVSEDASCTVCRYALGDNIHFLHAPRYQSWVCKSCYSNYMNIHRPRLEAPDATEQDFIDWEKQRQARLDPKPTDCSVCGFEFSGGLIHRKSARYANGMCRRCNADFSRQPYLLTDEAEDEDFEAWQDWRVRCTREDMTGVTTPTDCPVGLQVITDKLPQRGVMVDTTARYPTRICKKCHDDRQLNHPNLLRKSATKEDYPRCSGQTRRYGRLSP